MLIVTNACHLQKCTTMYCKSIFMTQFYLCLLFWACDKFSLFYPYNVCIGGNMNLNKIFSILMCLNIFIWIKKESCLDALSTIGCSILHRTESLTGSSFEILYPLMIFLQANLISRYRIRKYIRNNSRFFEVKYFNVTFSTTSNGIVNIWVLEFAKSF